MEKDIYISRAKTKNYWWSKIDIITIEVPNTGTVVTFKNCALFINCISEINNTQVDDDHDFDAVIPIHNLIEYNDTYSKTSGSLWQYYGTSFKHWKLYYWFSCW